MADDKVNVKDSERLLRLKKEIIPKIIEALDKDAEDFRYEIKMLTNNLCVSIIYKVELISCCGGKTEGEVTRLFVKMPSEDENAQAFFKIDYDFHNEITFYQRVGSKHDNYPKSVYIVSEPIAKAAIVIQDITQFGYVCLKPLEDLGMERVLAAVREIGKFHAQGYVLKEKNPKEFFGIADQLRESRYHDSAHPSVIQIINAVSVRPLNYLRSVNYDPEFCEKISPFLSNTHEKILIDCVKPKNELAVLCHGDVTSSNMMFKENNDGKFQAMLIDFAQFRYASPAIDLASFIYLSCEKEVRKHFSIIFRAYHETVYDYLKQHGIQNLEMYSLNAFLEDYKRHAIIGYSIVVFHIPYYYLGYLPSHYDFVHNSSKVIEEHMLGGGDELSKELADLLLEFKEHGYLDHML